MLAAMIPIIEKLTALIIGLYCFGCTSSGSNPPTQKDKNSRIVCTKEGCSGTYSGVEFINRSDLAHQYSNEMSEKVGDKLKQLYKDGLYSKVDFSKMPTL